MFINHLAPAWEADKGAGSGEIAPTGDAPGAGTTPPNSGTGAFIAFATEAEFQAAIDARLKDRLEREQRKALEAADKARKEAADKALADQQQYQTLADQRKAEIDALAPKAQLADELATRVAAQLDAEVSAWPDEVKGMDPGGDILVRLAWAEKARPLAAKLGEKPPAPGVGVNPKPAGSAGTGQRTEAVQQQTRRMARQWF